MYIFIYIYIYITSPNVYMYMYIYTYILYVLVMYNTHAYTYIYIYIYICEYIIHTYLYIYIYIVFVHVYDQMYDWFLRKLALAQCICCIHDMCETYTHIQTKRNPLIIKQAVRKPYLIMVVLPGARLQCCLTYCV